MEGLVTSLDWRRFTIMPDPIIINPIGPIAGPRIQVKTTKKTNLAGNFNTPSIPQLRPIGATSPDSKKQEKYKITEYKIVPEVKYVDQTYTVEVDKPVASVQKLKFYFFAKKRISEEYLIWSQIDSDVPSDPAYNTTDYEEAFITDVKTVYV